uniref:TLC domain-containing protein n=1 Tax=Acrobeloides nanus TaxID=290746 RepID=A0A914D3S9_9BILA
MIHNQLIVFATEYDGATKKPGMRFYCHPMPQYLIFMSFGYLLHDFVDLVINERSMRIIELLFHHVVVITAFCVTLGTRQFLGVVILGLLMELNSVFLHSRSLLNLYRQPKESISFRFVALVNIVTFFIFRMAISAYLIYWLIWSIFFAVGDDELGWGYIIVDFIVIASLTSTNSVLLYRVMAADGLLGKKRERPASISRSDEELEEEEELDLENEDEGSDVEAGQNDPRKRTESTQTGTDDTQTTETPSVVMTSTQTSEPFVQFNTAPPTNTTTGTAGTTDSQTRA